MNNLPRQKLNYIINTYGRSVCQDPRFCEALLRDLCGQYRPEINVIVNAIKEKVVEDLLSLQNKLSSDLLLSRLTKRLESRLGMSPHIAIWTVDSWALALGVISQPRSIDLNAQENLNPDKTVDVNNKSTPTPDKNINSSSKSKSTPKIIYIWSLLTTITTLGMGSAYYLQSQYVARLEQKPNLIFRLALEEMENKNLKAENKNLKAEITNLKTRNSELKAEVESLSSPCVSCKP